MFDETSGFGWCQSDLSLLFVSCCWSPRCVFLIHVLSSSDRVFLPGFQTRRAEPGPPCLSVDSCRVLSLSFRLCLSSYSLDSSLLFTVSLVSMSVLRFAIGLLSCLSVRISRLGSVPTLVLVVVGLSFSPFPAGYLSEFNASSSGSSPRCYCLDPFL